MHIRFYNTVEPVAPIYRDLLPHLAESGVYVDVVISPGDYRPVRKPLEVTLRHPNIRISRVGAAFHSGTGKIFRLVRMVSYAVGAKFHSILSSHADVNVFLTQPPLFALWGYVLQLIRKEPYICLVMDVYPDVAIKASIIRDRLVLAKILELISTFVLRNASKVVVIGRCMRDCLLSKGVSAEKIIIVPNWVNTADVYPIPHGQNNLRQELDLENDFVVLYSGNLGISHYFDDLLDVARRNRDTVGLKFVFVGDGARSNEISGFKRREGLDNLLLLPFQPLEKLAESLSLGDVHFVSLKNGFEGLEVPSKAYGALAVGRPLIYQGNPKGEIAQIILESGIGYVVPQGDVEQLEEVILECLSNRDQIVKQGQRALELAKCQYSAETGVKRYASLLLGYQPKK